MCKHQQLFKMNIVTIMILLTYWSRGNADHASSLKCCIMTHRALRSQPKCPTTCLHDSESTMRHSLLWGLAGVEGVGSNPYAN